jgi:hypothetical protein
MIRTYGKPALVKLIRSYAGGVSDDEAFKAALGVGTAGFNAAWLKELGVAAPRAYGPQPAPPGPLPPGWSGAAASAVPAAGGTSADASSGPTTVIPATGHRSDPTAVIVAGVVLLCVGFGILLARQRRRRAAGR